ncbi:MAG: Ig-like domain-containing protein [Planctomycetota bacterium]
MGIRYLTLLIGALLISCSSGGSDTASQTIALSLVSSNPTEGETGVEPSRLIELRFSSGLDAATAQDAVTVTVNGLTFPRAVNAIGNLIEIALGGNLPGDADVRIVVGGSLRGAGGEEPIADLVINFVIEPDEGNTNPGTGGGQVARFAAAAAPLANGRTLIVGGLDDANQTLGSAEILESVALAPTGDLATARWAHRAGVLADGRVLVCGGFTDAAGTGLVDSCEIFDPEAGTFSVLGAMATPRAQFHLVRTPAGLLVAIGGSSQPGGPAITTTIEAWDVFTETFQAIDEQLPVALTASAVVALPDGKILVAGGVDDTGTVTDRAFLVDPVEDEIEELANPMEEARHSAAAILLPTGNVLIAGGTDDDGDVLGSLEIFNPTTGTFTELDEELSAPRRDLEAVRLANGTIALVGGVFDDDTTTARRVEIFDASTDRIESVFVMSVGRVGGVTFGALDGALFIVDGATELVSPPDTIRRITRLTASALGSSVSAPRILSVSPQALATGVGADAEIAIRFSKPVTEDSVQSAVAVTDAEGRTVSGTLDLQSGGTRLVFRPDNPLPVLQKINVSVSTQIVDRLGLNLANDGARNWSFETTYDVRIGARDDKSQFGFAVAAGDVNGDGIDDMLVSAYVAESVPGSGTREGELYLILGQQGTVGAPVLRDLSSFVGRASLRITGQSNGDQLGQEASMGIEDINNDGFGDIVIGAHFGDGPTESESNRGEVFVVFGQQNFPSATLQLGGGAVAGFNILRLYGPVAGDKLGEGLSFGDVDNDGFRDMVIGATGVHGNDVSDTGAVFVVFGGTLNDFGIISGYGEDTLGAAATTVKHVEFWGIERSDRLGWATACGDLDNDGFADVAGGATGADGVNNANSAAGEVIVFFGASRATLLGNDTHRAYQSGTTSTLPGFAVLGEDRTDFYGWSIDIDDLDGDGFGDLAINGRSADGPTNVRSNAGEVTILFGGVRTQFLPATETWADVAISSNLVGIPMVRVFGEDSKDNAGDSVRFHDVDGDGSLDLVIGTTGGAGPTNQKGTNTGEVAVVRGITKPSGVFEFSLSRASMPAGITLTRFYGSSVTDRFGTSLAFGDFNGDGNPDILTGANKATGLGRLFVDSGEAYVLWGRPVWWK